MSHIAECIAPVSFSSPLQSATGKMPFTLTNDYLFRATFQSNKYALTGLAASILAIDPETITSIDILNPIELGKNIDAKDFILDIKVVVNHHITILIEMQVLNLGNWPERSLGYLCRSFDSLNKGQNYLDAKPVVQVSFLDFTLFKDAPSFFATYMFMNTVNHKIYSDKVALHVIDLTQIVHATDEDRRRGIDYWARLFKATTWEEIRMLSSNNRFLTEAAETLFQLSADDQIRLQCEAREDFYYQQKYLQQRRERLEQECASLEAQNSSLEAQNSSLEAANSTLLEENSTLAHKNSSLVQENLLLVQEKDALLQSNIAQEEALNIKNTELAAKDELIAQLQAEIARKQ